MRTRKETKQSLDEEGKKSIEEKGEDMFPFGFGYQPWLIQLHGRKKDTQNFMNPYNNCIEEKKIRQFKGKLYLGCFGEWLLLTDESTTETYFLHLTLNSNLTVHLPPFNRKLFEFFGRCVVSDSPTSPECMVTFVGRRSNAILYCRPNMDTKWIKVSLPTDLEQNCCFTGQVIRCKEKIYAIHHCGNTHALRVVAINESSLLMEDSTWTIINMPETVNDYNWHHLVASGEDIFLVSVLTSPYRGNPTNYTIHLLETSDLSWKRVKSIGGCVFFLSGIHNAALPASLAGLQHDCIFVVNVKAEGIYRICMQDQTVSLSSPLNRPKHKIRKLFWVMPTRPWEKKHRNLNNLPHCIGTNKGHSTYFHKEEKKEERCKVDISRPWADMPIELVELLLPRLSLFDCLRLQSICKAWNSLSHHVQKAQVYPWLMYTENDSCLWRLFDPVYKNEYSIDMKWLGIGDDLTFHYSKDGWVLTSTKDYNSLFIVNPLKREYFSLPNFNSRRYVDKDLSFSSAFSSAPTSPDCVVVILEITLECVLQISTWSPGEEKWNTMSFHDEFDTILPCKPVFSRGEFYWYRRGGELLVLNPYKKTRQVLEVKAPIMLKPSKRVMECHLVDSGEDLITVFRGRTTDPMRIFKLDRINMVWKKLHDMGGVTLFLDRRTTLATSCLEKLCRNQIYISGFSDINHRKRSAFYSLETKEYHPKKHCNLKAPMNCIWIEPNLMTMPNNSKAFCTNQNWSGINEPNLTS
ncbi:F-box protein family-like [Rhynchospora pubera]|uniref:F-box protein family-like n=1 Tax=Rhynchospora pubera TaxID=906938 RepID=A0AAV8H7N3_9POAL|nr:F-box protein family-like [Rhynchospora pubera]